MGTGLTESRWTRWAAPLERGRGGAPRAAQPQEIPVSIRVERGSWGLLLNHCRGNWPQDELKGEFRGLSRVAAWKPWVSVTCDGDLSELLIVPIGSQEYCGRVRRLSDSTGFGAMKEHLTSS